VSGDKIIHDSPDNAVLVKRINDQADAAAASKSKSGKGSKGGGRSGAAAVGATPASAAAASASADGDASSSAGVGKKRKLEAPKETVRASPGTTPFSASSTYLLAPLLLPRLCCRSRTLPRLRR